MITAERAAQLLVLVDTVEESDPAISTEQLLARIADMGGCESVDEVVEALVYREAMRFTQQVIELPLGTVVRCHHLVHQYEVVDHPSPGRIQLREVGQAGYGVGCPISYITEIVSKPPA